MEKMLAHVARYFDDIDLRVHFKSPPRKLPKPSVEFIEKMTKIHDATTWAIEEHFDEVEDGEIPDEYRSKIKWYHCFYLESDESIHWSYSVFQLGEEIYSDVGYLDAKKNKWGHFEHSSGKVRCFWVEYLRKERIEKNRARVRIINKELREWWDSEEDDSNYYTSTDDDNYDVYY